MPSDWVSDTKPCRRVSLPHVGDRPNFLLLRRTEDTGLRHF